MTEVKEDSPKLPEDFEEKLIKILRKNVILIGIWDNIIITFFKSFAIITKAFLIFIEPYKTKRRKDEKPG